MQAGALMAQIMAQEASEREIAQGGRNTRTLPPSGGLPFEREWAELSEAEFTRRYAMPRELMLSLFQRCLKATAWKKQTRRSHIPEMTWLAMVIQQLAKGISSAILCEKHCINESGYSHHRISVLKAIIEVLRKDPTAKLGWPDYKDNDAWAALAREFVPSFASHSGAFNGTVAVGYGTYVPMEITGIAPDASDSCPWRCRKVCEPTKRRG